MFKSRQYWDVVRPRLRLEKMRRLRKAGEALNLVAY